MITRLVIEIDHDGDTFKGWQEGGQWTPVDLREYVEHEGVAGVTIKEWELRGA